MKTLSITGHVGENVTFECSDWNAWIDVNSNDKYFCNSPCKEDKHVIIKTKSGQTKHKGRIHLNNSGQTLSVTFTDLQKSDSNTYYCGVDRFFSDSFVKVNLKVIDGKLMFLIFISTKYQPYSKIHNFSAELVTCTVNINIYSVCYFQV